MPAAVQTKSRSNRIKLFKEYYLHSTPNFRCYHGSRLPPRSFEGMFPSSKFFSKDIKWGRPVVEKKKVPKVLSKRLKAEPKKRKKRGILKKVATGKKKVVVKNLKKKKRVQFGKQSIHKRREQVDNEWSIRKGAAQLSYGRTPATFGTRGDPKGMFRVDAQGRLVQVAKPRRKILIK